MKALAGKLPPAQGIAAMQSINVVVINPWFLAVFFGTAAACVLAFIIQSLVRWRASSAAPFLLGGGVLYLVGTVVVTMALNVPREQCPGSAGAAQP